MSAAREGYADPYRAGVAIGVVLLGAFVAVGRGLGVSGAFASAVTGVVASAAPEHAAATPQYAALLATSAGAPLRDWLVVEVASVTIGGFLSAALAGRLAVVVERGPRLGASARVLIALAGGGAMGVGARLARGCTSGLALSGGAVLSVGSWLFVLAAFAAGYAAAPLLRRAWT